MNIRRPRQALATFAASALAFGGLALGQEPNDRPNPGPAAPGQTVKLPFLGVATAPVDPSLGAQLGLAEGFGLLVHHIDPDSPADAVLKAHDVLTKFNDQILVNHDQLAALVRNAGSGATVSLTVIRAGNETATDVALVEREVPAYQRHFPLQPGMRFPEPPNFRAPGAGPGPREFDAEMMERQMLRPQSETQSGSVTTTNKMRNATWVENGLVLNLTDNGKGNNLTIDRDGKRLFEGPIDTAEQRERIPGEVREAVERLEGRLNDSPKFPAVAEDGGDD